MYYVSFLFILYILWKLMQNCKNIGTSVWLCLYQIWMFHSNVFILNGECVSGNQVNWFWILHSLSPSTAAPGLMLPKWYWFIYWVMVWVCQFKCSVDIIVSLYWFWPSTASSQDSYCHPSHPKQKKGKRIVYLINDENG